MSNSEFRNFFDPNSFYVHFILEDNQEDKFKYNIKSSELPDIAYGVTSYNKGNKILYQPGTTKDEGSISMELLLDEYMYVYTDILELGNKYTSKRSTIDEVQIFLFNNQNVPILTFRFEQVFFSNVSSPMLSLDDKDTEQYITLTIFYKRFDIKRLNN